jgi:hypothetical protein
MTFFGNADEELEEMVDDEAAEALVEEASSPPQAASAKAPASAQANTDIRQYFAATITNLPGS